MGGFLSLYNQTDRVDMGGGYYVDIKRFLSDAEHDRAQRALVSPRIETTVSGDGDSAPKSVATVVDQQAYNHEVMVMAIVGWNLTDEQGEPLPLPPYMDPPKSGNDVANTVRRASIRRLPAFATQRILKQISDNEKLGADDAGFPGDGEGTPASA